MEFITMALDTTVPCARLELVRSRFHINELVTKFGGTPVWLEEPTWPLSKSTGKPMQFIGQILLDKKLFPNATGTIAYIFMTACSDDDFTDGTWEPEGGENAVIIQPGIVPSFITTSPDAVGPLLKKEFASQLTYATDPQFIAQDAHPSDAAFDSYMAACGYGGSKIGGTPLFVQNDEFPAGGQWKLLAQLDENLFPPFYINLGDCGVAYAFINEAGNEGRFVWQCP